LALAVTEPQRAFAAGANSHVQRPATSNTAQPKWTNLLNRMFSDPKETSSFSYLAIQQLPAAVNQESSFRTAKPEFSCNEMALWHFSRHHASARLAYRHPQCSGQPTMAEPWPPPV